MRVDEKIHPGKDGSVKFKCSEILANTTLYIKMQITVLNEKVVIKIISSPFVSLSRLKTLNSHSPTVDSRHCKYTKKNQY